MGPGRLGLASGAEWTLRWPPGLWGHGAGGRRPCPGQLRQPRASCGTGGGREAASSNGRGTEGAEQSEPRREGQGVPAGHRRHATPSSQGHRPGYASPRRTGASPRHHRPVPEGSGDGRSGSRDGCARRGGVGTHAQIRHGGEPQGPAMGCFQGELFPSLQTHLGVRRRSRTAGCTEQPPAVGLLVARYQIWPRSTRGMRQPDPSSPCCV